MKLSAAIQNRWSPFAFSEKEISDEMINLLFEAARWAPSSRNGQPWRYFYARKSAFGMFQKIANLLDPGNREWAVNAPLLIIAVMSKFYRYPDRPNGKAIHDTGAASTSMAIQAAEMGMQIHQMGGFDKSSTIKLLDLDTEQFEPVTIIAAGFPGSPDILSDKLRKRESEPRLRKPLTEFVTILD